jgi:DNA-binding CsgD family transcriptional regulator
VRTPSDHGVRVAPQGPPFGESHAAKQRLDEAIDRISASGFCNTLGEIADELPLALHADFVNLRLADSQGLLHLVAASGCSAMEIRKRAFEPLEVEAVRRLIESGGHDALARSLGIPWIHVTWLEPNGETVGSIAFGCRTRRRPTQGDMQFLATMATRLGQQVGLIHPADETLRECSRALARIFEPPPWPSDDEPVAKLRPRERNILELYADGLTTAEIAGLLVISRHTIRSHVRNALRTLGVHSREEAATLVRADQLAQLL